MKGYAKISKEKALEASDNYIKWLSDTEKLINQKIIEYYNQEYPKLSWFGKWCHRKDDPKEFIRSKLQMFSSYSDELYKVCTMEEDKDIKYWCYGSHNEQSRSIRSLANTSEDGFVTLDQTLAAFVEKWSK